MYHRMGKLHHKQKFTKKEDTQLIRLVKKHGITNWEEVASHMQRRTARQCRDRYNNYLSENFKKGSWTEEEDKLIVSLYHKIGSHWLAISKSLPGRSGNDIKNRWHKTLLKRIEQFDNIYNINDIDETKDEESKNNPEIKDEIHNQNEKNNIEIIDQKEIKCLNENGCKEDSRHEKDLLKKEKAEGQISEKLNEKDDCNVIQIFNLIESSEKKWNMFPNEEEKNYFYDI